MALLKIFLRANVAVGVKRRHRGADRAVQIQVQQVLLQQQQAARQAQLVGLFAQDTEHFLGAVNADDIIPCLGQHQGQIAGAAAQIGQDAVCDAVGLQLVGNIAVKRVIVSLAVELVVEIGKLVVGHRSVLCLGVMLASSSARSSSMPSPFSALVSTTPWQP